MKQLQCNFTTIEQSKRLLELGVPEWTADCVYIIYQKDNNEDYYTLTVPLPHQSTITDIVEKGNADYKDGNVKFCYCWSVGRLIEILEIILGSPWSDKELLGKQGTLLERVISDFEDVVKYKEIFKDNRIDFSKLEE